MYAWGSDMLSCAQSCAPAVAILTFVALLAVFRLGNVVHALVAARKTTELPEVLPRICLTASNLTRALYFFCDTVLWL